MDINALLELCSQHSQRTVVSPTVDKCPDWIVDHGVLRNTKSDYFSIGLYSQERGGPLLLITQNDPALVLLLASKIEDQDVILLSLRTEPGLIGLTNLTTTIQSTPSNYLRRHGGKSTPFIEVAMDPGAHGRVLYDEYQYDWGSYYCGKTKRFLIVALDSHLQAPSGFSWVPMETAKALLLEDHLVTNDLRVSIPLLAASAGLNLDTVEPLAPPETSKSLQRLEFSPGVVDCRGTSVSFFRTETTTREVSSWVQPLLVPREVMKISLAFVQKASGRHYAIERRTQPGLSGQELWFPVDGLSGKLYRSVTTSAEGGRFWKYSIHIELIEVDDAEAAVTQNSRCECWLSEENLSLIIAQPLQSSLELRMAWSLVYGRGFGA